MISDISEALLSLKGKTAIVTGGASGIGRGIAVRLAELGARVAIFDVDEENGRGTARAILEKAEQSGCALPNSDAVFIRCDVRIDQECMAAVESVVQAFGRVDILCNNAGIAVRKDIVELRESEWNLALDVTLKGVFLVSRHVIPHMIRAGDGAIVNTGSGWSLKGGPRAASYCAAKGGVLNLTKAMAIDYGRHHIRVNCVCPGDIDTPMLRSECSQLGEDLEEFMRDSANRPLARVGSPEDVANAVLFLVSDMSRWITGTALVVDGGGLA